MLASILPGIMIYAARTIKEDKFSNLATINITSTSIKTKRALVMLEPVELCGLLLPSYSDNEKLLLSIIETTDRIVSFIPHTFYRWFTMTAASKWDRQWQFGDDDQF